MRASRGGGEGHGDITSKGRAGRWLGPYVSRAAAGAGAHGLSTPYSVFPELSGGAGYYEIVLFDIVVTPTPADSALLALQRATHATLSALSRELAALRLTPAEINALANLADGRARTVSELGLATGTRPTTLT